MKTFTLKLTTEKNNREFIYALQETIKQLESGYTSGDLRNEDIDSGCWEIKKLD